MLVYKRGMAACFTLLKSGRDRILMFMAIFGLMLHTLFTFVCLRLDCFFFPGFRRIKVQRPVFIIGHPRSGTTFIHHLFTQTGEMAAFKAWHILFPALTARVLLKPIIDYFIRRKKTVLLPAETGHLIALDKVEEEEMLFLHLHDTQFITVGTPLGLLEDDFRDLRFHDLQPRSRRLASVAFLKECFQRQIYHTGNSQIFSQTHFSTHRLKTLLEVFPDALFIYMHRLPEETLPSYFSLNYNTLDTIWGLKRLPAQRVLASFERRYQASLELYRYFHDLWRSRAIDHSKVLIIPYAALGNDLTATFEKIIAFTGITPSRKLRDMVEQQVRRQKCYQREHRVKKLEEFGIDSSRLRTDFDFLYEEKDFKSEF